jgi:MFS transporter, Spinster family, sphingosine-1-phosphate transporter
VQQTTAGSVPEPGLPPAAGREIPITARGTAAAVSITPRWAWGMLALLFVMYFLVTVDRWLLAAVLSQVRTELVLTETQTGWISTILLFGLALASLPIGYLVDRIRRPRLLAVGYSIWSLATVGTGLAGSYEQIQVARALAGVGGAVFEVVALTVLMDLFPRSVRAWGLAFYFLAVPIGAAVGLSLGGALALLTTWQTAFLAVGAPGLLLGLLALLLPEPVRGWSENVDVELLRLHERVGPSREDYVDLMVNSSFTYSVFGITFSSFALAGLVFWSRTFLTTAKGLTDAQVDSPLALTLLVAALAGTVGGGWLASWSMKFNPRVLFIIAGLAMLAAIPCVLTAIYGRSLSSILGGLFLAEAVMFLNVVACYTIISAVVMPNMRAVGCAVALTAVHLLGDIWSPHLMGWVVDTFGQADSMATGFGRALAALGAVPVAQPGRDPENVTAGMLVVIPALLISGTVLLAGARHLPREMALMLAKLKAAPRRLGGTPQQSRRPSR